MARRTYDPTEVGETTLLRWGDLRWGDVQEATTGRRAQRARGSHDGRGLGEGDSTAAWAVCTREGIAPSLFLRTVARETTQLPRDLAVAVLRRPTPAAAIRRGCPGCAASTVSAEQATSGPFLRGDVGGHRIESTPFMNPPLATVNG